MIFLLAVNILGAALDGNTLYTWGDQLMAWSLPKLQHRVLAKPAEPFGPAGCFDASGAGIFLQEANRLVYRQAPGWHARIVDAKIDLQDCLAVTLVGRRGVLVDHRGMQIRFYEPPDFHYSEIY